MPITIFLVDDHAIVRDGLRALLENQPDFTVIGHATNGRKAVEQVTDLKPDVVIMDIAMPQLNGIEATEQIYAICPDIKIIILSIYDTNEHIFRALKAGARGYLLKKSAGIEVVDAIRAVEAGQRYMSQKISDTVINNYLFHHEMQAQASPLASLTPREREILQLVAEGKSSNDIGKILHLSPKTVESHRSRLMQKLGINGLHNLIKFAIQHGLTPLE